MKHWRDMGQRNLIMWEKSKFLKYPINWILVALKPERSMNNWSNSKRKRDPRNVTKGYSK